MTEPVGEPAGAPAYPPAPWDLAGTGVLTAWRTPASRLPRLPDGVRPATALGRASVVTVFVDYGEQGLMSYHELLAAVVVRHGRGVALSITDIWVDSEVSRAGGRGLWGIPKELAEFRGLTASDARGPIALATFSPPRRLPAPALPLPALPGHVVQDRGGQVLATPVRATGRVRAARADWTFPPAGPLAWLRGSRQVASTAVEEFTLRFG